MGLSVDNGLFLDLLGQTMEGWYEFSKITGMEQPGREIVAHFKVPQTDDTVRVRISKDAYEAVSQMKPFLDWELSIRKTG